MRKRLFSVLIVLSLLISQTHFLIPAAHGSTPDCSKGNHQYYNDLDADCNVCGAARMLTAVPGLDSVPMKDVELELLQLINGSRVAAGLTPFTAFRELQAVAEEIGTAFSGGQAYPQVTDLLSKYSISYGKELHVRNIFGGMDRTPEGVFGFISELKDNYDFFHGDFRGHIAISLVDSVWTFLIIEAPAYESARIIVPEALTVVRGTTMTDRSLIAVLNNGNGQCFLPLQDSYCKGFDPDTLGTQNVSLSVLNVSCGFTVAVTDPHAWDNGTVTKPATDLEAGVMTYTCTECGETKTAAIPPLGHVHQYIKTGSTPPTCTEPGCDVLTCACGDVRREENAPAKGHTPVTDPAAAPSCTYSGLSEGSHCGVCGFILKAQQPVVPTGHLWMDATCDTLPACGLCGLDSGLFRMHEFVDGRCTLCGEPDVIHILGVPMTELELEVLRIVNRERHAEGLSPLTTNYLIQKAAHIRAQELVLEFRMDHTRPDGSSGPSALKQVGYLSASGLENIAAGQTTAQEVMDGWMQSTGHRANILSFGSECIGIGESGERWVQLFSVAPAYTGMSVSVHPDAVYAPGTHLSKMNLIAMLDTDGDPCYLPVDELWCTGFDPWKEGTQTVTMSVLGLECTFDVTVGTHKHIWVDATCEAPKTCRICMETTGDPLPHSWEPATCAKPEACRICTATRGEATGKHTFSGGTCTVCGRPEPHLPNVIPPVVDSDMYLVMSKINELRLSHGLQPVVMTTQMLDAAQFLAENAFDANNNYNATDDSQILRDHGVLSTNALIKPYSGCATVQDVLTAMFRYGTEAFVSESADYKEIAVARSGSNWVVVLCTPLYPSSYRGARILMTAGEAFTAGSSISDMGVVAQLFTVDRTCHYLALTDAMCTGFDALKEGIQTVTFSCKGVSGRFAVTVTPGDHIWTDASCTQPKTCSHCGQTVGEPLGHSYKDGSCTRCGAQDPDSLFWGDANGDKKVNYLDAMVVLRHSVRLITLSEELQHRCDLNGDKHVNYMDAMIILRYAVRLIDQLPVYK